MSARLIWDSKERRSGARVSKVLPTRCTWLQLARTHPSGARRRARSCPLSCGYGRSAHASGEGAAHPRPLSRAVGAMSESEERGMRVPLRVLWG